MVSFAVNSADNDVLITRDFLQSYELSGGTDFRKRVFEAYPSIAIAEKVPVFREFFVEAAIRANYKKSISLLGEKAASLSQKWLAVEDEVFDLDCRIFELKPEDFDKSSFNAYVSTCPIAPRFLDSDSFLLPYFRDDDLNLRVAVHELMHFAFFKSFSGLFLNGSKLTEKAVEEISALWELSEITNMAVEQSNPNLCLPNSGQYPALARHLPNFTNLFENRDSIGDYFEVSLAFAQHLKADGAFD